MKKLRQQQRQWYTKQHNKRARTCLEMNYFYSSYSFYIFSSLFLNILLILPKVTFLLLLLFIFHLFASSQQHTNTHTNMPRLNESSKWRRCNCTLLLYSIFIMFFFLSLLVLLLFLLPTSYCLINGKVYVGSWLIYLFYFFSFFGGKRTLKSMFLILFFVKLPDCECTIAKDAGVITYTRCSYSNYVITFHVLFQFTKIGIQSKCHEFLQFVSYNLVVGYKNTLNIWWRLHKKYKTQQQKNIPNKNSIGDK